MTQTAALKETVREAVIRELNSRGRLEGRTIEELKRGTCLVQFTNKQVRRAIEALCYKSAEVVIVRQRYDCCGDRGWFVQMVPKMAAA